jgi:hypothetical protein
MEGCHRIASHSISSHFISSHFISSPPMGVRRTPHLVEYLHGLLPVPGAAARVHSGMEGHGRWGGGTALLRQTQVQHRQRGLPLPLLTQRAHHLPRTGDRHVRETGMGKLVEGHLTEGLDEDTDNC